MWMGLANLYWSILYPTLNYTSKWLMLWICLWKITCFPINWTQLHLFISKSALFCVVPKPSVTVNVEVNVAWMCVNRLIFHLKLIMSFWNLNTKELSWNICYTNVFWVAWWQVGTASHLHLMTLMLVCGVIWHIWFMH